MTTDKQMREKHRSVLAAILRIKKAKGNPVVIAEEIQNAVVVMDEEDVAYVEKIIGEKTI